MFLDTIVNNINQAIYRYDIAISYLSGRGITLEEINEYKIGYTRVLSVPKEDSSDCRRFLEDTYNGKKFESKIVFPIYNPLGLVVGLVARSIDIKEFKVYLTDEAKYTGVLLGLWQALPYIYEARNVFVVEGGFDLLALRKVYKNTVASLTAYLTPAQYELLNFFTDQITLVFDSDNSGYFGVMEAKKLGKNIYSVDIGYKDPDMALSKLGLVKFREYIQKKVGSVLLFNSN